MPQNLEFIHGLIIVNILTDFSINFAIKAYPKNYKLHFKIFDHFKNEFFIL